MAEDQKKVYPVMPLKQWWALRAQFRKTIPSLVTPNYLASTLDMTEVSARHNILPTLRTVGIIDDKGKPTELAVKWRDTADYRAVCDKIRSDVYPQELRDLAFDESSDRKDVRGWFQRNAGVGENAASKMAGFYLMLFQAEPSKAALAERGRTEKKKRPPTKAKAKRNAKRIQPEENGQLRLVPSLHLNLQIHISPQATAEQIDQIFASAARHLKELYQQG